MLGTEREAVLDGIMNENEIDQVQQSEIDISNETEIKEEDVEEQRKKKRRAN